MRKKKIKFSKQGKPEFLQELKADVKDYFEKNNISKYGNTSIIIKSIFMLSLYLIPYSFMVSGIVSSMYGTLFCWVIMGMGMAGLGMGLMHDANHGTYSSNPKVNKWLSKSLYLLGGFPPTWRYQHNTLHHGFTNIDGHDEDIGPIGILRFSPHKPLYKIHKFQHWYAWFFYGLMTISWVTIKDFGKLSTYAKDDVKLSKKKKYSYLLADLIFSKILYYVVFLILPLILIPVAWYFTVLFFLLMHFIAGLILGTVFQTAHVIPTSVYPLPNEDGNIETNWAVHQLLTTSNYSPKSTIFSWLIGGLNYQVEHHLFPNISHVHYKNIAIFVKNNAKKHNLPYYVQTDFFKAIRNHIQMLKVLGASA